MRLLRRFKLSSLAIMIAFSLVGAVTQTSDTTAASASDWRAGMIIDDALFYNNNAMSLSQIQSFLNSKVSSCDTWGTQPATEKGYPNMTHAEYAKMVGWPAPPYICTKDYYQVPRSDVIISNFNKTATRPSGSISAAQIIKKAADSYSVSPKALLVLLHKESAGPLTVDNWPLLKQYKSAMGYACPDTAPCDAKYAGFYNQMMNAAERIKNYKDNPTFYRHQPFALNKTVYYHPDLARCGSSSVYIESRATAGLYNYTPYQPNKAALNNLYGTGDSCSAYGNRNFWRIYTDWFGPTSDQFVALDSQRWLALNKDTRKIDTVTKQPVDGVLSEDRHIYYEDKIVIDGNQYLRTQSDKDNNINKAIAYSDLKTIESSSIDIPRYMELSSSRYKINPITGYIDRSRVYPAGTVTRFVDTLTVNGETFYRTEHDKNNGNDFYFRQSGVKELSYMPFSQPRFMEATESVQKVNPATGETSTETIADGAQVVFSSKMNINGTWYYRTKTNTDSNTSLAVPASATRDIPYTTFSKPAKYMNLTKDSQKINPRTGQHIRNLSNTRYPEIKIGQTITIDSKKYYQTETDMQRGYDAAIPADDMEEIVYVPLEQPRTLRLMRPVAKVNPKTGEVVSKTYPKGLRVRYTTKIAVNGIMYLRTEYDTGRNFEGAIPYSQLGN